MTSEGRYREKVMHGPKRQDTPILKGYPIFHYYLRSRERLDRKTPANVSGIKKEKTNGKL